MPRCEKACEPTAAEEEAKRETHTKGASRMVSLRQNAVGKVPGVGRKSMIEYEEVDLQLSQFLQKATTTLISPVQKSLRFHS